MQGWICFGVGRPRGEKSNDIFLTPCISSDGELAAVVSLCHVGPTEVDDNAHAARKRCPVIANTATECQHALSVYTIVLFNTTRSGIVVS